MNTAPLLVDVQGLPDKAPQERRPRRPPVLRFRSMAKMFTGVVRASRPHALGDFQSRLIHSPALRLTIQLNGADDGVEFIWDSHCAVSERCATDTSAAEHFVEFFLICCVISDCGVGVF